MLVASGSSQLVCSRSAARRVSSVPCAQNQPRVLYRWQLHRPGSTVPKMALRSAQDAWFAGTIVTSSG